jgi:hypothetical protein
MQTVATRVGRVVAVGILMTAVANGASQKQQWHGDGQEHGTPCAGGIVVVENDPGCPVEIEVLEARCREATHTIWAHYAVKNVSTKQIQGYELQTSERYERYRNDSKGMAPSSSKWDRGVGSIIGRRAATWWARRSATRDPLRHWC